MYSKNTEHYRLHNMWAEGLQGQIQFWDPPIFQETATFFYENGGEKLRSL